MARPTKIEHLLRLGYEMTHKLHLEALGASIRQCPATAHLHPDYRKTCADCIGRICEKMAKRGLDDDAKGLPYLQRPICAARTRKGTDSPIRVMPGKLGADITGAPLPARRPTKVAPGLPKPSARDGSGIAISRRGREDSQPGS